MTPNGPVSGIQMWKQKDHRFPNFEVSWAGESGWDDGYCFGSDDGRVRFTSSGREFQVESREPINGIAFTPEMMAVSTPSAVEFWNRSLLEGGEIGGGIYWGGAHDVISTPSGKFVAPLGPNGLLERSGAAGVSGNPRRFESEGRDFIFYKVASVGTYEGRDVLICALRRRGWARHFFGEPSGFMVVSNSNSDIVDVCRLQSDRFPRAAVALALDNSLRIIRDAATFNPVITFRLGDIQGTAYQIFSSGRQVLLLTSESLYSLGDLVHRCLDGERSITPTVRKFDVEAVGASIAHGRILLIVLPDGGVTEININDLAPARGHGSSFTFTPSMTFDDSPLTQHEMVLI